MLNINYDTSVSLSIKQNKVFIVLYPIIVLSTVYLLSNLNLSDRFSIATILLPFILLLSFNFYFILSIFILSLFVEYSIYYFSISSLMVPIVLLSYILTFRAGLIQTPNSIIKYLIIFIISIIPSYFVSTVKIEYWLLSYNLLVFNAIILIFPIVFERSKNIKQVAIVFLLGSALNSIFLIIKTLITGRREFGFAGIMFGDIVGIAIVISFSCLLLLKHRKKIFIPLTLLLLIGMVFTQTRNSWVTLGIVLLLLSVHFILRSSIFELSRGQAIKKIALWFLSILFLISLLQIVNPKVFSRVSSTKVESTEKAAGSITDINSLATRYFIWTTAYNVFLDNPIVGTGYHSFRFISNKYNDLDPYIYKLYVRDLTPHTTILALLADTGIIGFLGFITFLVLTLLFMKRNCDLSITNEQKLFSFISYWCAIYISISMIMTDAWLWGTLHVLWAILLGLSVSIRNNISIKRFI